MKKLGIVLALFCFQMAFCQKPAPKKGTATDWDELDKSFVELVDALLQGNKAKFLSLSAKEVDCVDCVGSMEVAADGTMFVPAEFFFAVIGQKFDQSPVYKAMAKKGYSFSTIILKDFKPKIMPKDSPKDLKIYEVWIETYYPGEFSKTHKGTSHSFRFVKVNGKFRFYGLTSIP